jgi:predicted Zn-ribbon and HTH transcriptional regulator
VNIRTVVVALLIVLLVGGVVLVVLWFERCPRCKSMWGPKGVQASLSPEMMYQVQRMCRKCGHSWQERAKIDSDNAA